MIYLIILIIVIVAVIFISGAKDYNDEQQESADIRATMDRMAQEENDRRRRMVANPQFPNIGGCSDMCTYANFSKSSEQGYSGSEACYCELYKQLVKHMDNCNDFIDQRNTVGFQEMIDSFKK